VCVDLFDMCGCFQRNVVLGSSNLWVRRNVIWLSASDASKGFSMDLPFIMMHSVASESSDFPQPCVYMHLDSEEVVDCRLVPSNAAAGVCVVCVHVVCVLCVCYLFYVCVVSCVHVCVCCLCVWCLCVCCLYACLCGVCMVCACLCVV